MVGPKDVIKHQLQMGAGLFEKFTADFSDAEWMFQPGDGGCHLTWIHGHLADTQDWAVSLLTGRARSYEQKTTDLFTGGATIEADAAKYPSRETVQSMFREAQETTLAAIDAFDVKRWDEPSPEGAPRDFFPTCGSLWGMLPLHTFWHFGQMTVARRMLGKPRQMGG
jgi:hypothetical protein